MFKPVYNALIVLIMLVAFVGQAFAYSTMACEMAGEAHQEHMTLKNDNPHAHHQNMNHQSMEHMEQGHTNNSDDCCGVNCMCPANACTSFTFVTEHMSFMTIIITDGAVSSQALEQPTSVSTSLYRPPIFA